MLCVNKMDLVDYDQEVFDDISDEFRAFATKLDITDLTFIPISALNGDNVVHRSEHMPWYEGSSLLHHLEEVYIASDRNLIDARFPVQYVIRPMSDDHHDYRGYAGHGRRRRLQARRRGRGAAVGLHLARSRRSTPPTARCAEAFAPMSVTIRLDDDIDVSRGDMICRPHNRPHVGQDIDAMICWMCEASTLRTGRSSPSSTRPDRRERW